MIFFLILNFRFIMKIKSWLKRKSLCVLLSAVALSRKNIDQEFKTDLQEIPVLIPSVRDGLDGSLTQDEVSYLNFQNAKKENYVNI